MMIVLFFLSLVVRAEMVTRTITIDFQDRRPDDTSLVWKGIDLETGVVTVDPKFNAPGWQFKLRAALGATNGGSVALFKDRGFEDVKWAPDSPADYTADSISDPWGPAPKDTYNLKLNDAFDYYMTQGHLFGLQPYVYILKTAEGHFAKIQFIDYIKNGHAIRAIPEKDVLGRVRMKNRNIKVASEDALVHLTYLYKYNTIQGDLKLE